MLTETSPVHTPEEGDVVTGTKQELTMISHKSTEDKEEPEEIPMITRKSKEEQSASIFGNERKSVPQQAEEEEEDEEEGKNCIGYT